jgi:hypothetical protein
MHSKADFPQFRAFSLNQRSVSDPGGIHLVAVREVGAADREGSSGTAVVVVSGEGWTCGGDAGGEARAGGGTPP